MDRPYTIYWKKKEIVCFFLRNEKSNELKRSVSLILFKGYISLKYMMLIKQRQRF